MDRVGTLLRAVRRRRGLRQTDVALAAGVSDSTVSSMERGHWQTLSFRTIDRVCSTLDIRLELAASWRGGDGDRLLNALHSGLAESFARRLRAAGWVVEPEVSFSVWGERGVIDQLAWQGELRHLLVIELKTQLVDVNELLGTLDRKLRLARRVAAAKGWQPVAVSCWLIVLDTGTNRRHVSRHSALLRARLRLDGRQLGPFLKQPTRATTGLAFSAISTPRGISPAVARGSARVRVPGAD